MTKLMMKRVSVVLNRNYMRQIKPILINGAARTKMVLFRHDYIGSGHYTY